MGYKGLIINEYEYQIKFCGGSNKCNMESIEGK